MARLPEHRPGCGSSRLQVEARRAGHYAGPQALLRVPATRISQAGSVPEGACGPCRHCTIILHICIVFKDCRHAVLQAGEWSGDQRRELPRAVGECWLRRFQAPTPAALLSLRHAMPVTMRQSAASSFCHKASTDNTPRQTGGVMAVCSTRCASRRSAVRASGGH